MQGSILTLRLSKQASWRAR